MASVANNTVGDYWVSTISIDDLPYPVREGHNYETVAFVDRGPDQGRIAKIVRTDSITDAQSEHDKMVTSIIAETFVPEWPKKYGILDITNGKDK